MTEKTRKILICDDEEGIRESLKLILEDHYDLILTADSEQCLDCLAHTPDVDLVMLDIKMPNKNGLETLKEIKARHSSQKVMMVTGYQSVELISELTELGAEGYVTKPFAKEELLLKVINTCG
ncbi:MAG: response regulator [Candidatus Omnitrophica bacterium]|nr:response regulator [Candidatus Omnitrophota bacterium]